MRKGRLLLTGWSQPQEISVYLQWVSERGAEDTTVRIYRGRLNQLAVWLWNNHQVGLLEASHDQLRAWRSSLRQSRRTVILYVTVCKGFYRWAHRNQLVSRDPAWNLPLPRYRKSQPRPIDTAALTIVIEGAQPMVRLWLILAAFVGLRAMELAALRREDIYENRGQPYMVIEGKGGKERTIPLSLQVWNELLLFGLPARGEIFRRQDGRPFTPGHLDKLANRYLHDMGVSETLHQLRHWFGTHGQEAIGDLRVLGALMGHANPATTAGYAAPSEPKARELVEKIILDPWPTRLAPSGTRPPEPEV